MVSYPVTPVLWWNEQRMSPETPTLHIPKRGGLILNYEWHCVSPFFVRRQGAQPLTAEKVTIQRCVRIMLIPHRNLTHVVRARVAENSATCISIMVRKCTKMKRGRGCILLWCDEFIAIPHTCMEPAGSRLTKQNVTLWFVYFVFQCCQPTHLS